MDGNKRARSPSPERHTAGRNGDDRKPRRYSGDRGMNPRHSHGGRRRYGGRGRGDIDPEEARRLGVIQMITNVGDLRNLKTSSRPLEERVMSLADELQAKGLLDDIDRARDMAKLIVRAGGALSMQTSVYAVLTCLLTAKGKSSKDTDTPADGGGDEAVQGDDDEKKEDDSHTAAGQPGDSGPSFGRLVVDGTCGALSEALRMGGFIRAKLLLRFLGELVNCGLVQVQEFGHLLEGLSSSVLAAQSSQVKQPCKDMVAHMLLSAVLWVGPALAKGWAGGLSNLLEDIRRHMDLRKKLFRTGGLRAVLHSAEAAEDSDDEENAESTAGGAGHAEGELVMDGLCRLWDVVSILQDDNWKQEGLPSSIPRLWAAPPIQEQVLDLRTVSLPEEVVTAETIPREIRLMGACALATCAGLGPALGTTSPCDRPDWSYGLSLLGEWSLFNEDSGEGPASVCQDSLSMKEHVVLREFVKDVLACFQPVATGHGTKVGMFPTLVEQLLSVRELAPDTCKTEYLVTETVFLALLQLPTPKHLGISYGRTILELCRAAPTEVSPAVALCTGRLFQDLERMDTTVAGAFGAWFAEHLKNSEYKWPFWSAWEQVTELSVEHPQRAFVTRVLATLVGLSYLDRIKQTLPEGLRSLLPHAQQAVCPCLDEGEDVSKVLKRVAGELLEKVKAKATCDQVQACLDEQCTPAAVAEGDDSAEMEGLEAGWRANILMQVLLRQGQTSPTHTMVYLDRYKDYLLALSSDEDLGHTNQVAILDAAAQVWQYSSHWFCLVCQRLLWDGVLTPAVVVHYFFREDNSNAVAYTPSLWELVHAAIVMALERVRGAHAALGRAAGPSVAGTSEDSVKGASEEQQVEGGSPGTHDQEERDGSAMDDEEPVAEAVSVYPLKEAMAEVRTLCLDMCHLSVQAFASALLQYQEAGVTNPNKDPWWVSMTSYFKAGLRMFAAVPPMEVNDEVLVLLDERTLEDLDRIFAAAGTNEHVQAILSSVHEVME